MDMMELKSIALHEGTDPPDGPWPKHASSEYVAARRSLLDAEMALRDRVEEVAALRRALPPGALLADYEFMEGPPDLEEPDSGRPVSLAGLFGDHDPLVVYHLMFHPDDDESCPSCALWVDGLHGVSHHIERNAAFAVIAKAPLPKLRAWARHRGWDGLRIVSSHGNSFNEDLQVEGPRGGQWPVVSVFVRDGDGVRHFVSQHADPPDRRGRGIDLLSPVWNVLDLLPQGRGEWLPDNGYPGRSRGLAANPA
jgi:predicted dithiol-disulfide oxidoreductase (DUF899 family)